MCCMVNFLLSVRVACAAPGWAPVQGRFPVEGWVRMACKPGFVLRNAAMTIHLGCQLPDTSCSLPGERAGDGRGGKPPCSPYLALLPVGLAVPPLLPEAR